jgi:transposase
MRKCREILKQTLKKGRSSRDVGESVGVSPGSVWNIVNRAEGQGLVDWKGVEPLSEQELEGLLFPPKPQPVGWAEPDPVWIHTERQKRKHVTLELLHLEYLGVHPTGLKYTAFCDRYRRWTKAQNLSMRQVHRAGEKTFFDYSGDRAPVVDPKTGEVREAEIFVATMGASSYTFAEATWTQKLPDWTASHVRASAFFGGVSELWIPDRLRSAVSDPDHFDPEVNRTYLDLARHYDATVVPARSRKPKDKAKVESAVLVAQRWVLAPLRNETFFSLEALNARIAELVSELNDRPMDGYGGQSRRERFELLDRPALQPLPLERYVYADWCKTTVKVDYHAAVEGHWYSVPYQLALKVLEARYTATTVELFHRDQRVASHARSHVKGDATTSMAHMPKAHRAHAEISPARFIERAAQVGPDTERLVTSILESQRNPEASYGACKGILRLAKDFGNDRLEAAATRGLACGLRNSRQLKALLKNGLDRLGQDDLEPAKSAPIVHENVRGPQYYN